jgi:microcystin-dependent protein
MSDPFVGEIRMFAGNFPPAGWAFCNGQLLPISENDILFQLIGTTYGGDGQETFALPNLQSRVPLHQGQGPGLSNYIIGEAAGVETVTLTTNQIPSHTHGLAVSTAAGTSSTPSNKVLAASNTVSMYKAGTPVAPMGPSSVALDGGSQPHNNLQPYLAVSFIISLFGYYPTQN